jgi:hypothetical protein
MQFKKKIQQQNPLKNQYLPHLSSENCEINSILNLTRSFIQHKLLECAQTGSPIIHLHSIGLNLQPSSTPGLMEEAEEEENGKEQEMV